MTLISYNLQDIIPVIDPGEGRISFRTILAASFSNASNCTILGVCRLRQKGCLIYKCGTLVKPSRFHFNSFSLGFLTPFSQNLSQPVVKQQMRYPVSVADTRFYFKCLFDSRLNFTSVSSMILFSYCYLILIPVRF